MTLYAHVYCGYASYDDDHKWGQSEHDAHKLILTLKGEPINGYAKLKRPDGVWVTIRTDTPGGAFQIWQQWARAKVAEIEPDGALLVPVPSSSCIAPGGDEKGMRLAELARPPAGAYSALQCLHWGEQFPKARDGGPRDVARLFANSRVRDDLPAQRLILIDDVVTGGGHLIACARALRSRGHIVEHAICAAHTVKSPPSEGLWKIDPWDLEADPFEGFFGL